MNYKILLVLLMLSVSCAPMPGGDLQEGIRTPGNIRATIIVDAIDTTLTCNRLMWDDPRTRHQVVLNCLLNGCYWLGCSTVEWDRGEVTKCVVHASFDFDWIIGHELEHCKGYVDKLY